MATYVKIRIRRDTEDNWKNANPLLLLGEIGCDMTNRLLKVGNGVDKWNDLEYIGGAAGGSDGGSGSLNIVVVRPTAPDSPQVGSLYFDSTEQVLKFYDGNGWITINPSTTVVTPPPNPSAGTMFYNPTTKKFSYWDGADWVVIPTTKPGASAPTDPTAGDLFFDTISKNLKYYDGTQWCVIPTTTINHFHISLTPTPNPEPGDLYFNDADKKLYYWNSTTWVVVGSGAGGGSGSGINSYIAATYNETSPVGNTGDILYASDTKQLYRWSGSKWEKLAINPTASNVDVDALKTEIAASIMGDVETVLTNKLKSYQLFGQGYTITPNTTTGRPEVITFQDGVVCTLTWNGKKLTRVEASTGEVCEFVYNDSGTLVGRTVTRP